MAYVLILQGVFASAAAGSRLATSVGEPGLTQAFQGVRQVQERGSKEFGVNSTPTFFINGEKKVGALTIDEFDKILTPLLARP